VTELRTIRLRYAATCVVCGAALPPRTEAFWDKSRRAATCLSCLELASDGGTSEATPVSSAPLDRGVPGGSADRRYVTLHDRREADIQARWGRLGGVYRALTVEPQSTRAWAQGGRGERALGGFLEGLHDDETVIVLHDRRIPRSRANIDHVAITRTGVYVIDAKNYTGEVRRIDKGGWFSTDLHLYVGRHDCTKLLAGMTKQVEAVRSAVGQLEELELKINPALCFVAAEWSLFTRPFFIEGIWIGWGKALAQRLTASGPFVPEQIGSIARRVAEALPPA
jgi:hypothetical protein